MGEKENIAPRQEYVGWADIGSVEYKYSPRNAVKYVLRLCAMRLAGCRRGDDPDSEEAWEYYTWLGSKWNDKFFPAIDTAISATEYSLAVLLGVWLFHREGCSWFLNEMIF